MEFGRIRLSEQKDALLWSHDKYIGDITAAEGYDCIASSCVISGHASVFKLLWKLNIPNKIVCFIWLLLKDHILTWDQLQCRGRHGPSLCMLCRNGEDSSQHIFMDCMFSRRVYSAVGESYGLPSFSKFSFCHFVEQWFTITPVNFVYHYLPLFFLWCIWKQRNRCIFDNKIASVYVLRKQIFDLMLMYPVPKKKKKSRIIGLGLKIDYPCGFFDGAAAGNIGGAGFVILLSSTYFISYSLGCGRSTNTKSEFLALWALLTVAFHLGIPLLSVYGDSQVIISWVNRKASLNAPLLSHWCDDILSLLQLVPPVTINHIYRKHN